MYEVFELNISQQLKSLTPAQDMNRNFLQAVLKQTVNTDPLKLCIQMSDTQGDNYS